jgi:hypothetical protein
MTVAELDQRMSRREMTEWQAFYAWEAEMKRQAEREAARQRKG